MCPLAVHQPLWACLYASAAACLMLQKEMPFKASGDSYQAHHSTEHICPALCLPGSLQSKDLVHLLASNHEGRDGLLGTARSAASATSTSLSQFSKPARESSVLGTSGSLSGFKADPASAISTAGCSKSSENAGKRTSPKGRIPLPLML